MGKGHRLLKKVKSEKAKVKLKGSKHLPKGTNVTDTNFKIKQIVIREQLKVANQAEPLSKRKLNIKELLNRLQHYNTTTKTDAITDLKEIVALYPSEVVVPNLNQLIHGVSHLVLDKEKSVRQDSLRLISVILTQVTVDQVAPFFDILCSYFRCAMTHIDGAIQEDSLLLLDVLLTHIPSLVAIHSHKILENFFDLISKLRNHSKPGRTLTLNLGSKLTTVKWRIKVLNRLYSMLDAIIQDKHRTMKEQSLIVFNSIKHNERQTYYPVQRHPNNLSSCLINLNDIKNKNISEPENHFVKYINHLVPLLFETWLEVGPVPDGKEASIDVILTEESASLLNCILNILYLLEKLLTMYGKETGDNEIGRNFILKYRKDFSKYVLSHFPYSKTVSKKRKRNEKNSDVQNSALCAIENLMICHLFCVFNPKLNLEKNQKENAQKLTNYVKNILPIFIPESAAEENKHALLLLKSLLLNVSKSWNCCNKEIFHIFNLTLELYANPKLNTDFKCKLFHILCDIVNYEQFNKSPQFQMWLSTLPDLLCQPEVSEKSVNIINQLVKQNNTLLNNALKDRFIAILENVSSVKILDTTDEMSAKFKIVSLVHYISTENTLNYGKIVANSSCDSVLKKYFQDILILKFEQRNEHKIVERLRNIN